MKIYDVQVNHLTNPLGFRMERVSISWKVGDAAGKRQESARVVVAAGPDMAHVLLDTGFDPGADCLGWELALALRPRTRYYYTVAVRSDAGEEAVSPVQWFETGKRGEPWAAEWIGCDNGEKRHPYFEKAVAPRKEVSAARLYVCGLGLYEAFYNGKRIGEEYFTPYSNDYNRWVQVQTFDVTEQLREPGTLSILLGNGWYKGRFGFSSRPGEERGFYGDQWKLIAELRLTYADGTEDVIGTDESWTVRRSTITFSNLYDGEHRDDTLPPVPAAPAVRTEPPAGAITDRMSTPVTVHETFTPAELIRTPKGELVLDMGQEFTGIFKLRLNVPKGTEVHLQTGEILQQGCFYNENLRSAKSEYRYISNGGEVELTPHFTFFGYRYVKIEGVPDLKKEDFTGLALYSHIPERGRMTTGHELVNRLLSNVRWGLKSNFLDVPTDCPQRDERMGWTGDAQVFAPTATYLQDTYGFYAKYLYDLWQEQQEAEGKVPDVIPSAGVNTCATVWGDAACIIPWTLYRFYGDKAILQDQFPSMKAWVDYIRRFDGDTQEWRKKFHYGDWLALDNMNGDPEQCLGATDEEFIAQIYYAASAEIVAKAARVLGDREGEQEYAALSKELFDEVRRDYYTATGRCAVKTQTALILSLKYGLGDREMTISQLQKLFQRSDGKLMTGFVGTPLLCPVLSDNGMEALAWQLLLNEDYPGWLREVKLGATTIWERWNSLDDDGNITGIGMNSMNHYAYGSIAEWLFTRAAGLRFSEEVPGCRRAEISPLLNWELREQETELDSPCGVYRTAWKLTGPSQVELSVTVPFGASAVLTLPHDPQGRRLELEPGTYHFAYETDVPLKKSYSTRSTVRELLQNKEIAAAYPQFSRLPGQHRDNPLRDVALQFRAMTEEQLDELDAALAKL